SEVFQELRCRCILEAKRCEVVIEFAIVSEGEALGFGLKKEIKRIQHRHLGNNVHLNGKFTRLVGKNEPGEIIGLRVLLPVDEMFFRRDSQRVAENARPSMRSRAQAHGLRTKGYEAVILVTGFVMELNVYGHGFIPWSNKFRSAQRRWCRRAF